MINIKFDMAAAETVWRYFEDYIGSNIKTIYSKEPFISVV